jgi:thiamine biosynthesis lipoprotein
MGTLLEVEVEVESPDQEQAWQAIESAFSQVKTIENRLSTWKLDSELSRFNALQAGQKFVPSAELSADFEALTLESKEAESFFSPYLGPLVRSWGLRSGGRIPSAQEIARALQASRADSMEITPAYWMKRNSSAGIEEGGFGKGLALDRVRAQLQGLGVREFRMNFGGQVLMEGTRVHPIAISDPTDRAQVLLQFDLKSGSVSTSGNSEHGLKVKKGTKTRSVGHLLNPKTGAPARDVGSVTAIAETGLRAEILSKLFVLGPKKGLKWANEHARAVLFLSRDVNRKPGGADTFTARMSCAFPPVHPVSNFQVNLIRECPGDFLKKEKS